MILAGLAVAGPAAAGEEDDDEDGDGGTIVVEDSRVRRSDPREAGASVTVVPLDERLPPGSDVADAVARSPGTTVRRLGGLGSFAAVSIRGAALRQVQVVLDGLPLNPDGSAAVNLASVPLQALDRVEVWRGAPPPELAAAPMGGLVHLRTSTEAAPLSVTVEGGSWTTGRAGVRGATRVGDVHVLGGASAWTTRGDFLAYDDNGTPTDRIDDRLERRASNDRRQASGLLRLRDAKGDRWSALGAIAVRDEGLPGPLGLPPAGRLATRWGLVGAQRRLTGGALRVWAQGRDEVTTPVDGPRVQERQGHVGLHAGHALFVRPTWSWTLTGQARADARKRKGTDGTASRATATLVTHARWTPTPALLVEPVIHGQAWRDQGWEEADRAWRLAVNPRLTSRLTLSEAWVVHAAAGRAVRPPDFLELFGDRGAIEGRGDLSPERGWWADAGVRALGERADAELAVFAHQALDRIVFIQTGGALVARNSAPSWAAGIELGGSATVGEHLDLRGSLTWTETRVYGEVAWAGRRLPRVPRLASTVDVGVRPVPTLRIGATFDGVSGNAWDSQNTFVAPPRLLLGLDARWSPTARGWPDLFVGVRNVTNTLARPWPDDPRYPDTSARVLRPITDFARYPLPGRTLMVGVHWTASRREVKR